MTTSLPHRLRLPMHNIRLLTLDAFGTIFHPKEPIGRQYLAQARQCGPPLDELLEGVSERDLDLSFRHAFQAEAKKHPNFGKAQGMLTEQWWANVISSTFHSYLPPTSTSTSTSSSTSSNLPLLKPLIRALIARFSSSMGYTLYPDILPFLQRLQKSPDFPPPVVGIITNSDDRVSGILASLGVKLIRDEEEGARVVRYGKGVLGSSASGRVGERGSRAGERAMREEKKDDGGSDGSEQAGEKKAEISFVALSYDVEVEKPHVGIFDAARWLARRCEEGGRVGGGGVSETGFKEGQGKGELRPEECVHIGDDVEKDYWGARDARWNAVLVQRTGGQENSQEGKSRREEGCEEQDKRRGKRQVTRDTITTLDQLELC